MAKLKAIAQPLYDTEVLPGSVPRRKLTYLSDGTIIDKTISGYNCFFGHKDGLAPHFSRKMLARASYRYRTYVNHAISLYCAVRCESSPYHEHGELRKAHTRCYAHEQQRLKNATYVYLEP